MTSDDLLNPLSLPIFKNFVFRIFNNNYLFANFSAFVALGAGKASNSYNALKTVVNAHRHALHASQSLPSDSLRQRWYAATSSTDSGRDEWPRTAKSESMVAGVYGSGGGDDDGLCAFYCAIDCELRRARCRGAHAPNAAIYFSQSASQSVS